MLFSVLMTVYNTSKYLCQSIDSLLLQDFKDWELIIVDDGSTDESGKICDEYAQKYDNITVIHKENGGPFLARKTAIELAKGDYCLFLDSDDFVENNYFEKICDALNLYKSDVLVFNFTLYYAENNKKEKYENIFGLDGLVDNKNAITVLFTTHLLNSIWAKAIKTNLLKSDPLYKSDKQIPCYGEDKLQSVYPMLKADRIAWIDDALYCYRQNGASIMNTYLPEKIKDRMMKQIFCIMLDYAKEYNITSDKEWFLISSHCYNHMRDTFERYFLNCKTFKEAISFIKFNWVAELPDGLVDWKIYKNSLSLKEKFLFHIIRKNNILGAYIFWVYVKRKFS